MLCKMFSVHINPGKFENDTLHRTLSYNPCTELLLS